MDLICYKKCSARACRAKRSLGASSAQGNQRVIFQVQLLTLNTARNASKAHPAWLTTSLVAFQQQAASVGRGMRYASCTISRCKPAARHMALQFSALAPHPRKQRHWCPRHPLNRAPPGEIRRGGAAGGLHACGACPGYPVYVSGPACGNGFRQRLHAHACHRRRGAPPTRLQCLPAAEPACPQTHILPCACARGLAQS